METEYDDAGSLTEEQEAILDTYYAQTLDAKIDALIAERDALWARYDALVATHGVWSREADTALIAASRAEDTVQTTAREFLRELES